MMDSNDHEWQVRMANQAAHEAIQKQAPGLRITGVEVQFENGIIENFDPYDSPRIFGSRSEAISFNEMMEAIDTLDSPRVSIDKNHEWQRTLENQRWHRAQRLDKVRDIYFEEGDEE